MQKQIEVNVCNIPLTGMPCSAGGAQHDHTTTACQDASNQIEHGRGTAVAVQSRADKQRFAGSSARLDSKDTRPRSIATGKTLRRPAHAAVAISNASILLTCRLCLHDAKGMACSRLCICYLSLQQNSRKLPIRHDHACDACCNNHASDDKHAGKPSVYAFVQTDEPAAAGKGKKGGKDEGKAKGKKKK